MQTRQSQLIQLVEEFNALEVLEGQAAKGAGASSYAFNDESQLTIDLSQRKIDNNIISRLCKQLTDIDFPVQVTVRLDTVMDAEDYLTLAKFIKQGRYPKDLKILLVHASVEHLYAIELVKVFEITDCFVDALCSSQGPDLHLELSLYCFNYLFVTTDSLPTILYHSTCLRSFTINQEKESKKENKEGAERNSLGLPISAVSQALRANSSLLELNIPSHCFSTQEDEKVDFTDVNNYLERNRQFISHSDDFLAYNILAFKYFPLPVLQIIQQYEGTYRAELSAYTMLNIAIEDFCNEEAILERQGFRVFFAIYKQYQKDADDYLKTNNYFMRFFRKHLGIFLKNVHHFTSYKRDARGNGAKQFTQEDIRDDIIPFLQLAGTTKEELPEVLHALALSSHTYPIDDLINLMQMGWEKEPFNTPDITTSADSKSCKALELFIKTKANVTIRHTLDNKQITQWCKALSSPDCRENMRLVLEGTEPTFCLLAALTKLIKKGSYPKNFRLIMKFIYDYRLENSMKALYKVLIEKTPFQKPPLHLIIASHSFIGWSEQEIITLIKENKNLRSLSLILPITNLKKPERIKAAILCNHTLHSLSLRTANVDHMLDDLDFFNTVYFNFHHKQSPAIAREQKNVARVETKTLPQELQAIEIKEEKKEGPVIVRREALLSIAPTFLVDAKQIENILTTEAPSGPRFFRCCAARLTLQEKIEALQGAQDSKTYRDIIFNWTSNKALSLPSAFQLLALDQSPNEQAVTLHKLEEELDQYDRKKGFFRRTFHTKTQTVQELTTLLASANTEQKKRTASLGPCLQTKPVLITQSQVELCMKMRDQRWQSWRTYFSRSGFIKNEALSFFQTRNLSKKIKAKLENNNNKLSETENLILRLGRLFFASP